MEFDTPNDPVIRKAADRAKKWRRFAWVLVLLIAAWASMCIEQVFTNTDWEKALKMSAAVGAFVSPFMLIILIPAGLIGRDIGNWKPFRPYRWWISLVLPLALCAWPVAQGCREWKDPALGFKRYLDTNLPKHVRHLNAHVQNFILSDLSASYSFECSREETELLIQALDLTKAEAGLFLTPAPKPIPPTVPSGFKNPRRFNNYSGERYTGFVELWTDETTTRVYIHKWNT